MGFLSQSSLVQHINAIRSAPREVIFNPHLLMTAALYALTAFPLTWDQGSSSVTPSLQGFAQDFGITSAKNPGQISNFVSLPFAAAGVGSALSYFMNDRLGRLWSFRLYMAVYMLGQLIATTAFGSLAQLYVARIISGLGIGLVTVTGPVSIVEVAPPEIRGLLSVWFSCAMGASLCLAVFTVYGVNLHMAAGRLQYQVVFFVPILLLAMPVAASFFLCESPRWLCLVGRSDEALATLVRLRGLPADHPRVAAEMRDIQEQIARETREFEGRHGDKKSAMGRVGSRLVADTRETFLVPANLRRLQQALLAYALAQLSGANAVTTYLVPILNLVGVKGGAGHSMFISGMYGFSKLCVTLIASFFLVDIVGRRRSLFAGIITQMLSHVYLGVFICILQRGGDVPEAASQAAIAMIFIHGFGYSIGLLVLPYVIGAEVWPNKIRSFGAAISQSFHWLFMFAIVRALPSILSSMNNWGAFIFFAAWCFTALIYVFFCAPETTGLSLEKLDELFEGPWWNAHRRGKELRVAHILEASAEPQKDSDEKLSHKKEIDTVV